MRKIGFIELANHNEVLRAYLIQVLSLPEISNVCIFTSKWIYTELYDFHFHPLIKWSFVNSTKELDQHEELLSSLDLVVLTTLEDKSSDPIVLSKNLNSAAVIHKFNTYFRPFHNLQFSKDYHDFIKDVYRLGDLIFRKNKKRKMAIDAINLLIFPTTMMKTLFDTKKESIVWPFTVNDELPIYCNSHKIKITIPGTISSKSRDYDLVLEAFKCVDYPNIELTFLGKPQGKYGKRIIESFRKIQLSSFVHFEKFIPQSEFDEIMRKTDFLILPMLKYMKFGVVKERNGYSCVSGNINDMIRYGLPALVPDFYPLDDDLNNTTSKYTNSLDLARLINDWSKFKTFNTLKETKMQKAMENFSKIKTAENFNLILRK